VSAVAPLRRTVALTSPATAPRPKPAAPRSPKPAAQSRPRLVSDAERRSAAGRLPFLLVVGAVLIVGLVVVLLLHMVAAQDGFKVTALQARLATLTAQEQQVAGQVEADSSPTTLQQRARALGMVPTTLTSIRRLHDGRAVGTQAPVYVPPPVTTTTKPHSPSTATKSGAKGTSSTATKSGAKGKASATAPSKRSSHPRHSGKHTGGPATP
jgi:hypothetical protein